MELDKYSLLLRFIPPLIEDIFNKHNIKNIADLGYGDGSILYSLSKMVYLGIVSLLESF